MPGTECPFCRLGSVARRRGFTLMELLVAITLMGLVVSQALYLLRAVHLNFSLFRTRNQEVLTERVMLESLAKVLLDSKGLVEVGEKHLVIQRTPETRATLRFEEGRVWFGDMAWGVELTDLRILAEGPRVKGQRDFWNESEATDPALDSLDFDGDGVISYDELDADRSGVLEAEEAFWVARLTVELIGSGENGRRSARVLIHPRNHLPRPAPVGEAF